jgi:hypothetical protein
MKAAQEWAVASALIAFLALAGPAVAATGPRSAPIGSILQATHDKGEIDSTSEGTTIYDGDALATAVGSTLLARLGGPQMFLASNSGAIVHSIANGFSANLSVGTVTANAGKGQTFQLLADGFTVQPLGETPAIARMTLLNATQIELTSLKGTLKVSMGDQTDTIEPGTSYRLEVETEAEPGPAQNPPVASGRNRFKIVAIIILGAATAIVIWRATVSPSAP